MSSSRRAASRLLLPAICLLALGAPVRAATISANGTTCALGDAIVAANTDSATGGCPAGDPGFDTIVLDAEVVLDGFDPRGRDAGLPDVTDDLVIRAGAADLIRRDPNLGCTPSDPLFRFLRQQQSILTLDGLRFEDGCGEGEGGGILSSFGSTIHLNDVTVRNFRTLANESGRDDGTFLLSVGPATVTNSLFEDIEITGTGNLGGGVVKSFDTLTIESSAFRRISAPYNGRVLGGVIALESVFGRSFSLTVRDTHFSDISIDAGPSLRGGVIYADTTGSVTLEQVTFTRVEALARIASPQQLCAGAALHVRSADSVHLDGIAANDVSCSADLATEAGRVLGGAFYVSASSLFSLSNCVLRGSRARLGARTEGSGGALYAIGGAQRISRCSFIDSAIAALQPGLGRDARGGALYLADATSSTLRNVVIHGGRAQAGDDLTRRGTGGDARGGGLVLETAGKATATLAHVTLAQNEASAGAGGGASGGGLAVGPGVQIAVDNTILTGNLHADADGSTFDSDCVSQGVLTSAGYNLAVSPDASCVFAASGDQVGVDPLLAAVGDYGCVTPLPDGSCIPTLGLDQTSPAVDAGSCVVSPTETDARGSARFRDVPGVDNVVDACDIGAFEAFDSDNDGDVDLADLCPGGDGNPCDLCTGNDAFGDGDMDGLCADRDCDDGDPTNACGVFESGYEVGDTSEWTSTVNGG